MEQRDARILVADDDRTSRGLLAAVLGKWGHQVELAEDGQQAWAALQRPDGPLLAVLDWMMPGLSGVEICRQLRRQTRDVAVHVILLTGRDHQDDIVAGLRAGAADYVTKPFNNEELRARVDVGLRLLSLQQALARRVAELEQAAAHIRTLQGLIKICMHCHRVMDDEESWQQLEQYIEAHSDAQFSHGLCPRCFEQHYGQLERESG